MAVVTPAYEALKVIVKFGLPPTGDEDAVVVELLAGVCNPSEALAWVCATLVSKARPDALE
jgi:hypothetical protein